MITSTSDGLPGADLLRGLVLWERQDSELEAGLAAASEAPMGCRGLAQRLTGLVVPEEVARSTFDALAVHVEFLFGILNR